MFLLTKKNLTKSQDTIFVSDRYYMLNQFQLFNLESYKSLDAIILSEPKEVNGFNKPIEIRTSAISFNQLNFFPIRNFSSFLTKIIIRNNFCNLIDNIHVNTIISNDPACPIFIQLSQKNKNAKIKLFQDTMPDTESIEWKEYSNFRKFRDIRSVITKKAKSKLKYDILFAGQYYHNSAFEKYTRFILDQYFIISRLSKKIK